jgi:hypothetical protein
MAAFLCSGLLVVGLLGATEDTFTFEGTSVQASTGQPGGFFSEGPQPFTDEFAQGTGSATLEVEDRIRVPGATYGDAARLTASFRLGVDEYVVELTHVGFPPPPLLPESALGPPPRRPAHPVGGGVLVGVRLHGASGLGWPATAPVQAAAAVWGVGRVSRNGQLLTDRALVHAAALSAGAHADDETHRTLPRGRPGDTELYVLATNLPRGLEPRGFVQFEFDDVDIRVGGAAMAAAAALPNTAPGLGEGPGGAASSGMTPPPALGTPLAPGAQSGTGLVTDSTLGVVVDPTALGQAPSTATTPPNTPRGGDVSTPVIGPPGQAATPGVATTGVPDVTAGTQSFTQPTSDVPVTPGVVTTGQGAPTPSPGGTTPGSTPSTLLATPGVATTGLPGPAVGVQTSNSTPSTPVATPGVATTGTPPPAPTLAADGSLVNPLAVTGAAPVTGAVGVVVVTVPAANPLAVTGAAPVSTTLPTLGSSTTAGTGGAGDGTFAAVPATPVTGGLATSPLASGPGSADVPGARVEMSPGLLSTPPVAGTRAATAPPPLPASPAPANALGAVPLPASPAPANAAAAPPLAGGIVVSSPSAGTPVGPALAPAPVSAPPGGGALGAAPAR